MNDMDKEHSSIVFVHGGVENNCENQFIDALIQAVQSNCCADRLDLIDIVEETVKSLEDNPLFNAGYGSVLNLKGRVEMDAAIMDGATGRCGSVAAIQNVQNPVSIARKIMEETPHVLLTGSGAKRFARQMGFPPFNPVTKIQRDSWEKAIMLKSLDKHVNGSPFTRLKKTCDTVGCVAAYNGRTAAACSTGGTFLKLPGRVGDSPVIGAGIFASPHGAAVCTGKGEAFIEIAGAVQAVNLLAQGFSPEDSGREIINKISEKNATGGILIISYKGEVAAVHNSSQFPVVLVINGKVKENFEPLKITGFSMH